MSSPSPSSALTFATRRSIARPGVAFSHTSLLITSIILSRMCCQGVEDWEPRVVNQLMEFVHSKLPRAHCLNVVHLPARPCEVFYFLFVLGLGNQPGSRKKTKQIESETTAKPHPDGATASPRSSDSQHFLLLHDPMQLTRFHPPLSTTVTLTTSTSNSKSKNKNKTKTTGYTSEVLEESFVYCDHAGRSEVNLEDVKLAIQGRERCTVMTRTAVTRCTMHIHTRTAVHTAVYTHTHPRTSPNKSERYANTNLYFVVQQPTTSALPPTVRRSSQCPHGFSMGCLVGCLVSNLTCDLSSKK